MAELRRAGSRLRNKIIAWSFVPTAILMFLVALSLYFAYQQVTVDLVLNRDEDLTRLSAGEISSSFEEYIDRLDILARLPQIYEGIPTIQRLTLEKMRNSLNLFDTGIYILNNRGTVTATLPENPRLVGDDWSGRSFFRSMVRLPRLVITDIEPSGPNGEDVIALALPILGPDEELRGAAIGMFQVRDETVTPFYGSLIKLRIGQGGNAFIVDRNRRVIFSNNSNSVGDTYVAPGIENEAFSGQVGVLQTTLEDGSNIVAGYAPVPRTPWTLIITKDWDDLVRNSQGYLRFLWLLLVFGMIFPTLVVVIGVRRITGPIADFISAAQRIAGGDFTHPIQVNTGDELEELADQFNTMTDRLKDSYETLEERVAQRTEQLTALNSVAEVVSRSLNLDQILSDGLVKTIEVLDMDAGAVFKMEPYTQALILVNQRGLSPEMAALIKNLPVEASIIAEMITTRHPVARHVSDYAPGALRDVMEADGLLTVVSIPLMAKDVVLGAINVTSRAPIWPTLEALAVPSAIGQQIGVAMDNARLYNQTVEYANQMEAARSAAEQARAVAEAANTAKSNFLANVSHELRTPLVSIFGFTRIVQKRLEERIIPALPEDDGKTSRTVVQIEENLRIILDEGQRLMTLINDLLDLEKIEAGKIDWVFRQTDLGEVIRQATTATASLFEGKHLRCVVSLPERLPPVSGDPDRLKQVIINLVSNAVKFTPHGEITVRARSDNGEVVVDVIDQGIGIDPSDQEMVFEKFSQFGDPLTSKPKGTGLGLAISKEIIAHHGGRIWFESAPDRGSQFSFALPILRGGVQRDERIQTGERPGISKFGGGGDGA